MLLIVADKLSSLEKSNAARFEALSTAVEEGTKARALRMEKVRAGFDMLVLCGRRQRSCTGLLCGGLA